MPVLLLFYFPNLPHSELMFNFHLLFDYNWLICDFLFQIIMDNGPAHRKRTAAQWQKGDHERCPPVFLLVGSALTV